MDDKIKELRILYTALRKNANQGIKKLCKRKDETIDYYQNRIR